MKLTHGICPLLLIVVGVGLVNEARADGSNLLAGRSPTRTNEVRRSNVLTDGIASREGDFWDTALTAPFKGQEANVVFDLGSPQAITAAWLQGDNNDVYIVEVSADGNTFTPLWRAPAQPRAGLRERFANALLGKGRFVRIRAEGGDGSFALSEVQLFASEPQPFPPQVRRRLSSGFDERIRDLMLDFGVALILAVMLARARSRWSLVLLAVPAVGAIALLIELRDAWPLDARAVSIARGTLAAVAAMAVVREVWAPGRFPAHRGFVLGTLGLVGLLSVLAFYNLGQPQFWDNQKGEATFVHHLDLRQYHPTAKYFRELGYRGIYEADVAAYAESEGLTLQSLAKTPMRDLAGDYGVVTVADLEEAIKERRARFTPQRWEAYKRDSAFFREVMGTDHWLDTMHDFGGNATPVWMSIAHLLWRGPPTQSSFALTGLFDLLLFALAFGFIGKAFGPRTMFVCMVVFGSNDFIMYGTNWAGATLRHDWLVYLALAACALKLGRPVVGGALIGAATMIRAFPLLALAGVCMPVVWSIIDHWRDHRRLPDLRTLRATNKEAERVLLGAAGAAVVLFAFSAVVLSAGAWPEWYRKASQLAALPHPADISFRSFLGGWGDGQHVALRRRLPLLLLAGGLLVGASFIASRGSRPARSMLLGLALVPVLMNPANYYSHLVFLLVMLGEERTRDGLSAPPAATDAGVWLTLLFMCVAQYFTELITDRALHFYFNTAILMATLGTVLFLLARQRALAAGWLASPVVAPPPVAAAADPTD